MGAEMNDPINNLKEENCLHKAKNFYTRGTYSKENKGN